MKTNQTYPHVTIIILNWNQEKDSLECLNSVSRINYPAFSIVVVDNGSTDGSPDSIEKWSHLNSPVKLIRNSKNRGFVAGSNQAMRFALTTLTNYMFLLNLA